ncbi:stage II sporulation protein P [Rossellomorea marisflavi]|uniref:stage II sporulation protein P n=1 Tax=Rossellomorea marisflavi TaxID=189381 RepID=UPI00207933F0|nr:stage II sporulation protein P [Rossellomorea marisflavi]USK90858.1 stage II sporulation protein P [Rossellomorea marisflavi]
MMGESNHRRSLTRFLKKPALLLFTLTLIPASHLYSHPTEGEVFLYFTHSEEAYGDGRTVMDAGVMIKKELENEGIHAELDRTDVIRQLLEQDLHYGRAYEKSRELLIPVILSHRQPVTLLDIHRDAVDPSVSTATIHDKRYARIAFVIGRDQPGYEKNLEFAREMVSKLESASPGITRGIILKGGADTDGRFNQDLSGHSLLLEFGGVDNSTDEIERSARAFSKAYADYLNGGTKR